MANIELDGANKKIKVDSGDLTLDVPGDIILDADGADLVFADGGTNILKVTNSSSDVVFQPQVDAKDIIFKQYDGTTVATIEDNGTLNVPTGKLAINATAITSTAAELNIMDGVTATAAELNIMDGVTATAAEINLIDGGTARGTTAIADGDGVLINDAGTMRQTTVETLKTYIGGSQWALISTTTASNSAKVEIRGLNDSDYFQFLLILDRVTPASDDVGMRILLENSANNNFGAYDYAILGYDDGGDEQRANGGDNSVINAVGGVGSDSGEEGVSGNIYINNPSAQKEPSIQFHLNVRDKDHDIRVVIGSASVKDDSEDANGIQLDFTSGNIESGTFKLYGLKAS